MARYEGGQVTVSEVDAHILRLPADDRPTSGQNLNAWYGDLVRVLVVDRELLEQAQGGGLAHDESFRRQRMTVERELTVQSCLREINPAVADVSNEQLEAAYAARASELMAPERRSTFHIYKQMEPGLELSELESEMQALRKRILNGESFQRLAGAESDSESRHRKGAIGWIVRGQLPEAFEKKIFALEEGVPSEPILAADGVHLFQIDDVLPQRRLSMSEVGPTLRAELKARQIARALDELAAKNANPVATMVDRETLDRLLERGSEQAVVLAAEEYSLSVAEVRRQLGSVPGNERVGGKGYPRYENDRFWQSLKRLHRREAAYEYCKREGLVAQKVVDRGVADWERQALTNRMRDRRLLERVLADTDRLQLYYQSNIGQFTPPVRWHLERLRIPFENPAAGRALMKRLETVAAAEPIGLAPLQRELGGELESLGWTTLREMTTINPKLPQRVSPLGGGALVAPLRVNDFIELYRVGGRKQFEPMTFEQVRDRVASAYLRQYTMEVYDAFEADLLEGLNFELYTDRLGSLRKAGLPSKADVSVEELDALLGGK